jgi:hypothetical protein
MQLVIFLIDFVYGQCSGGTGREGKPQKRSQSHHTKSSDKGAGAAAFGLFRYRLL